MLVSSFGIRILSFQSKRCFGRNCGINLTALLYSDGRLEQGGSKRRGPFFPAQLWMEIDLRKRNVEPGRAQQISDPLGALHRLFQTAGKQLDVFLVGFERKFAL